MAHDVPDPKTNPVHQSCWISTVSHSESNEGSDIGSYTGSYIRANVSADVGTDATRMQRWVA